MPYKVPNKYAASLYADRKSAQIAKLEAERDRLRALCNWAAGRLLDAGDVEGHEKILRMLEKP